MESAKVLIVATEWWSISAHIAISIARHGAKVAFAAPVGSALRKLRSASATFSYRPWAGSASLVRAINSWDPDIIIPADDGAVYQLHKLHEMEQSAGGENGKITELIVNSLGCSRAFPVVRQKSLFMSFAEANGVRCPRSTVIGRAELDGALQGAEFPIVLKADGTYGGSGVRVASTPDEARAAYEQLTSAPTMYEALTRSFDRLTVSPIVEFLRNAKKTVSLQQYISGRCAHRAVVCRDGQMRAGLSVEVVETVCPRGPASVVRVIDNPAMSEATKTLCAKLRLNGFHGFDFILDSDDTPWLLEINPRIIPIAHLSLRGSDDLVAELLSTEKIQYAVDSRCIALFPQELRRDQNSGYLKTAYHDVPWSEPEIVQACLDGRSERSPTVRARLAMKNGNKSGLG